MLSKLTNKLMTQMSIKNKLKKKMTQFLTVDLNATLRTAPTTKQRKYINVQIAQDFKKLDNARKKQRFENIKKRQLLLQQKLKNEGKLLSGPQTQSINAQIKEIKKIIEQSAAQIQKLNAIIDSTEASHILVQGYKKLVVSNRIKYLQYLHNHNPGYTLHPETIKAIENIDYCVNHNLPINRIKLYEIMPQFFETQIGELQESVRRLIKQKQIYIQDEESTSSIRFFHRINQDQQAKYNGNLILAKANQAFNNALEQCVHMLKPHEQLVMKVHQGKTPFRSIQHMNNVMQSDLAIKYLPQEQAYRQDLLKVIEIANQWNIYKVAMQQKYNQFKHRYIPPPPYIANHPVLRQKYELMMKKYTNPVSADEIAQRNIPLGDMRQVQLGDKMREQLRRVTKQKFDPMFVQAMNSDRSSIDKKKIQIQFYQLATNVYENLRALQDKSQDQQIFQKIPKDNKKLLFLTQRKKNLLRVDEITRLIFLNNKDKNKYNLDFFSQWFGVDKKQLEVVLRSISYLRVPAQQKKKSLEQVQFSILKFQV